MNLSISKLILGLLVEGVKKKMRISCHRGEGLKPERTRSCCKHNHPPAAGDRSCFSNFHRLAQGVAPQWKTSDPDGRMTSRKVGVKSPKEEKFPNRVIAESKESEQLSKFGE